MSLRSLVEHALEVGERQRVTGDLLAVAGSELVTEIASGSSDAIREVRGLGACLRVRAQGRTGSVSTTSLNEPGRLWELARTLARYGPPDLEHVAAEKSSGATPAVRRELGPAVDGADRAGVSLRTLYERTGLQVHATVRELRQQVIHAEVGGVSHESRQELLHLDLVLEGGSRGDYDLTWTHWDHHPRDQDADPTIDPHALGWFEWAARWQDLPYRAAPSGLITLVLTPAAVHAALSPLVAALSGAEVLSGRAAPLDATSPAANGPVLHPALELWDGGGPYPTDDEGTPTAELRLVTDGHARALYHSRHTAAMLEAAPTGHGLRGTPLRRAVERSAQPALSDVRLDLAGGGGVGGPAPRRRPWLDLIAAVRRGVVVDSLLGAGQARQGGVVQQRLEGRVRTGWVLEAGRVVGRIEPVALSVPLAEVLVDGLRAVSEETWPVGRAWTGRLPFVVVSGVRIR